MDNKQKLAKLRKALYGTAVAVAGVATLKGYVDSIEAGAYLLVVSALLGVAFYNVDDTPES